MINVCEWHYSIQMVPEIAHFVSLWCQSDIPLLLLLKIHCNEVDRYGKKEAGTGEHSRHFNNKINKHKWKAAAPHGRLPHTKHKLKSRPGPLSSSTVVTPHLTLPKLLRGTRDRWVVQVSFITNYSTGLAPFPQLSAPPHSSHTLYCKLEKIQFLNLIWFADLVH